MMEQELLVEENDFLIKISPLLEGNEWTGNVDVSIISAANNNMNENDLNIMAKLVEMVASAVPVMSEDSYVLEALEEYVESIYRQVQEEVTEQYTDNVIKLDLDTKTRGNA